MSNLAFKYIEKNNPDGGTYAGVGLHDLTVDEFNALPDHIKRSVMRSTFYEKVKGARGLASPGEQTKADTSADDTSPQRSKDEEAS